MKGMRCSQCEEIFARLTYPSWKPNKAVPDIIGILNPPCNLPPKNLWQRGGCLALIPELRRLLGRRILGAYRSDIE
jgi:hypothetical protein